MLLWIFLFVHSDLEEKKTPPRHCPCLTPALHLHYPSTTPAPPLHYGVIYPCTYLNLHLRLTLRYPCATPILLEMDPPLAGRRVFFFAGGGATRIEP